MIYRFDKFEVSEEDFCLTREGEKVALEPRALRVLLFLIQNPGKLLHKRVILESVWKDIFVEESTLSRAVALLRKQLRDDPRNPTYIETVPTLGYRFIAKVEINLLAATYVDPAGLGDELLDEALPGTDAANQRVSQDLLRPAEQPGAIPYFGVHQSTLLPRRRMRGIVLSILLLLLLAGGAGIWRRVHRPLPTMEKRAIVLGDFSNATGETVFNDTLREGLTVQLEQSPTLNLVSEPRIQNTLHLMNKPADARLTPDVAREICQRAGGAATLEGSIVGLGSQYVLTLHATNCATGEAIATEQVQAARKEDVLHALSQIASRIRNRLGESLESIRVLDTPLDEATTSSLEALKAFSDSNRVENLSGSAAAIPLAKRAVELDPGFALAWAILGRLYGDIGQEMLSAESSARAYEFRDHANDHERFFIVASYEMQVTGNLEKAEQACETWAQVYPNDAGSFGFRAGLILRVFGKYDKALENAEHLVALHPDFALAYHFVALNDIALARYKEAQQVGESAAKRNFNLPYYALDQFRLAFLAGDEEAMARVVTTEEKMPGTEDILAGQQASAFAYHGQLEKSREVSQGAVDFMKQSGRPDAAARSESGAALREAFVGNREQAKRLALTALGLSSGRDAQYGAAVALALSGDSNKAEALARELERRFPEDTSVHFHYVPTLRALAALNRPDAAKAIDLLKVNIPYELGSPQSSFSGFYGVLYPVYVRGMAYLMLHRGEDATSEFRKILDHPGLVANDPVGALARLQLGRAYVESRDLARAQEAYRDVLTLWSAADQDLPMLKQSQLEFARIEGPNH